jgi:hypothetical protein
VSVAPTELEHLDLSFLDDMRQACFIDNCDEEATHRLVHIPCGWSGALLCKEHATIAAKGKWFMCALITVLLGRCRNCHERIVGSKTFKVVPIKP